MAKLELADMSKAELVQLREEVDQALSSLDSRRKAEAKKAAEEAAKKFGFSLGDLVGKERGRKNSGDARYRNPANPSQTWSGRGRQPGWIKEGLAQGRSLSEFAL